MTLAFALARLEANDRAGALAHLCDAWRAVRDPALATTIETLAATLPITRPAGKTVADKQKNWLALAKRGACAELGGLLATLTDIAKADPLRERIWRLSERPHDPRIASALVGMLASPPILGGTFRHPAIAAGNALVELADVRQVAALERFAIESKQPTLGVMGPRFPEVRTKLAEQVRKHRTALDPADAELLAKIDAALAGSWSVPHPSSDALFAAVYANPDDDAPRLVLADELQRRGDPRGEFIALQLVRGRTGTRTKRERELLAAAGRDWLGPLDPVIAKTGVVFERGFLSACALRDNTETVYEGLADRPEWRTIEDLDLASGRGLLVPVHGMPMLRALRRGYVNALAMEAPHLVHLEMDVGSADVLDRLAKRQLPALRHLVFTSTTLSPYSAFARFWASPLAHQLETLEVMPVQLERWLPAALDAPIDEVTLWHGPWGLTLREESASLRRTRTPPDVETFDALPDILRLLPHDRITRVEIAVPTKQKLPTEVAAELERFDDVDVRRAGARS